jgi:hypothetical protein
MRCPSSVTVTLARQARAPAPCGGAGWALRPDYWHSPTVTSARPCAIWENGTLVRSLCVSPGDGVLENIGEPYDFEVPYWAGEHPVVPVPGWPSQGPYRLAFHPLSLGEDALRALFGFILEGYREPGDIDPFEVRMHEFRVSDPTGQQQAEREAAMKQAIAQMGTPRRFRLGPDGALHEITRDNP